MKFGDRHPTGELEFKYPGAGDEKPLKGEVVILLTAGGTQVFGEWDDSGRYLGWGKNYKRNKEKEAAL